MSDSVSKIFGKHALSYLKQFGDVTPYAPGLDFFLSRIPEKGKILDLGCGPGNLSTYCLNSLPNLKVTGIDSAPEMVELASMTEDRAEFIELKIEEIHTLHGTFHGFLAGGCFPYISDQELVASIEHLNSLCKNKSALFVSSMIHEESTSRIESDGEGDSMRVWYRSKEEIPTLLERFGWKVKFEMEVLGNQDSVYQEMVWVACRG